MLNYYGVSVFTRKNDSKSIGYYKYLYNFYFIGVYCGGKGGRKYCSVGILYIYTWGTGSEKGF